MSTPNPEPLPPDPDILRRIPVFSERLPTPKGGFNAGAFFAHKDRLALWCIATALAALLVSGLSLTLAISSSRQPVQFVVLDPIGNCLVAPGMPFHEAKELHLQQAMMATTALLLRNPRDFDLPELLQSLFSRKALTQAAAIRTAEAAEFTARQIRQVPEISKIEAISTRQAEVQIQVTGQLVRTGMVGDAPFTELVRFTLRLVLSPNPDLLRKRGQPTLVTQFSLKYEPSSS